MSRKRKKGLSAEERLALRNRRIALGLYLLFLACCFVGTQNDWWQVLVGEKAFGDAVTGPDFLKNTIAPPATLAAIACVIAFFFASYNLVADADIQLPVFFSSLLVAGTAGYVLYRMYVDQQVIQEVTELVMARDFQAQGGVAALTSETATRAGGLTPPFVQTRWGLALYVSSSIVMLLISGFLTFIAPRAAEKS